MSSEALQPTPFEFHEKDFPNLIEFIKNDIASRTVPPQEVPPPPARILALAKSLRDNGVHAGGEPLYVPIRGCDGAAVTHWKTHDVEEAVLNRHDTLMVFFASLGENLIATDRAKAFIKRLDYVLQNERKRLNLSCVSSSFSCDLALLEASGVFDEIKEYVKGRCKELSCEATIERDTESGVIYITLSSGVVT